MAVGGSAPEGSPLDCLIAVPYDCTGRFAGCERAPAALRRAGIVEALELTDLGNMQVAIADPRRDPDSGVIGLADLLAANRVVRDRVGGLLGSGRRPLVLGGDCTLLIGVAAALGAHHPGAGLAFVDGHLDCYDGTSSPTGEGADMELAALLGVGAEPLVRFAGRVPSIEAARVVCLGPVDEREAAGYGAPDPRSFAAEMKIIDGPSLLADPAAGAREALERLGGEPGFWLHLDLDVLSAESFGAVDYPQRIGLDWGAFASAVGPLLRSPALLGADLTIYNPTLDPDGSRARRLVAELRTAAGL